MHCLSNENINCPYCGEQIELIIDCSIPEQEYIEDCEVCCRPINLYVLVSEDNIVSISPRHENE